jgi:hypothetical protein
MKTGLPAVMSSKAKSKWLSVNIIDVAASAEISGKQLFLPSINKFHRQIIPCFIHYCLAHNIYKQKLSSF